jgi:hypothetical protein
MNQEQLDRIEQKLDLLIAALPKKRAPKKGADDFNPNFEAWWKIYPKKVGKVPALRAWNKIRPPVSLLVKDVQTRIENDRQWKAGFIPNPATYLNQKRWDDEIQLEVIKQAGIPDDNQDLLEWAQNHGHRGPYTGETWDQYRTALQTIVGQQL